MQHYNRSQPNCQNPILVVCIALDSAFYFAADLRSHLLKIVFKKWPGSDKCGKLLAKLAGAAVGRVPDLVIFQPQLFQL